MLKLFVPAAVLLFVACFFSCSKDHSGNNANICDGVAPKTFASDVNPIIQSYCNQPTCHQPGSTNGPGSLTSFTEVFNARAAIRDAILTGLMPQNATLTMDQRKAIICWIDNGAPNN